MIIGTQAFECMADMTNDYCRELAPGTVRLTGDRAQGVLTVVSGICKHCIY